MWLLGLVLALLGLLIGSGVLFWIGVVLFIAAVVLYAVPARRDSRRWYW